MISKRKFPAGKQPQPKKRNTDSLLVRSRPGTKTVPKPGPLKKKPCFDPKAFQPNVFQIIRPKP